MFPGPSEMRRDRDETTHICIWVTCKQERRILWPLSQDLSWLFRVGRPYSLHRDIDIHIPIIQAQYLLSTSLTLPILPVNKFLILAILPIDIDIDINTITRHGSRNAVPLDA
jgi:hypothetical protein